MLPVDRASSDRRPRTPLSDREYGILRRVYSYEKTELLPRLEATDASATEWKTERITFNASYRNERVPARLYLPTSAKAPYQLIVYSPAGHSRMVREIDDREIGQFDFLMRSGRAVLFPVYQGTYERRRAGTPDSTLGREEIIEQCQDLRRALDYLQTRPDIDQGRLGLFAISSGTRFGLITLAQDVRLRAAVLAEAGLFPGNRAAADVDAVNFAPHVQVPVLMLNGRDDFIYPLQASQIPLFHLLGSPANDKRHVLFDKGHMGSRQQNVKETLAWFDRYLGAVARP